MNVLVVYTHPNHQSLSYAFLQKVLEGGKGNSSIKSIQVLDLYEDGFDPVLVFNEEKRRRDMHVDPKFEKYRQQIIWADKIVFIYPMWWGRQPAMLMGYFDQVLASNFAYKSNGGLIDEGLLKGKSAVCISVMKGPALYPLFFLNNSNKALMKKAVLNYVGIKKIKFFEFGSSESNNKASHLKKLDRVYRYFKHITS